MINDNIYACLSFIAYVESMLNYSNGNIQTIKQVHKQFSTTEQLNQQEQPKLLTVNFPLSPKINFSLKAFLFLMSLVFSNTFKDNNKKLLILIYSEYLMNDYC